MLPYWETGDPNDTLQYKTITPQAPGRTAEGKYIYRVSGVYM